MRYEKKIRYLEYWENGSRVGQVGFAAIQVRGDFCDFKIQVNRLPVPEGCTREVRMLSKTEDDAEKGEVREVVFARMEYHAGGGMVERKKVPVDAIVPGIKYDDLDMLRISLGKNSEILCHWKENTAAPKVVSGGQTSVMEGNAAQKRKMLEAASKEEDTMMESIHEKEGIYEKERTCEKERTYEKEDTSAEGAVWKGKLVPREELPGENEVMQQYYEDKWLQLQRIYPKICPFEDERSYLSIGPQDFVILPEKFYKLIHNSFLLHGYYNYGHMILARTTMESAVRFYLGVPGNFYEKERQAALMFGFESFECKKEPVQMGDYGYYMIRVEL